MGSGLFFLINFVLTFKRFLLEIIFEKREKYNDSEVTGATIADVLASQAYMLLYVDIELANEQDSS